MGFKKKSEKVNDSLLGIDLEVTKVLASVSALAEASLHEISLRGISVSRKDDGSWMGILRVSVGKYAVEDGGNVADGWAEGDYVSIVNATSFAEALAKIEDGLYNSTLELSVDKFSSKRGKPAFSKRTSQQGAQEARENSSK